MDRLFAKFAILFLIAGAIGCKSVRRDAVIGTWTLDPSSRDVLPADLKNANGKFVFHRDGSFVCSDVPGLFYVPEQIPARRESGRGRWRQIREEGNPAVQLDFQVINNWKGELPYGAQLFFSHNHLEYFLGDPDDGRAVVFDKR